MIVLPWIDNSAYDYRDQPEAPKLPHLVLHRRKVPAHLTRAMRRVRAARTFVSPESGMRADLPSLPAGGGVTIAM